MGDRKKPAFRARFDRGLRLEFHGAKITSDAGLLLYRELDDVFGLTSQAEDMLNDSRTGKNVQHTLTSLPRQSVFRDNEVRLKLFALAYNPGNFLRQLALPRKIEHWSLTTLREKVIKIGAKAVKHSKYFPFQLAEAALSKKLFAAIRERIQRLRLAPGLWMAHNDRPVAGLNHSPRQTGRNREKHDRLSAEKRNHAENLCQRPTKAFLTVGLSQLSDDFACPKRSSWQN